MRPSPRLEELRARHIQAGPWSVTFARPATGTKAGPNDYFSEGPYWWPDPATPGGPYIRRDGETNPDRFTAHHNAVAAMSEAVFALSLAAHVLDDKAAASRAWEVARVWFADPKTRMTPHLEFGQAIRGVTEGRGIGLIDTRPLIWSVQGLSLLEARYPNPPLAESLRDWFATFTQWVRWSTKGRDEIYNGNNHSSWWTAQVAAYSLYTGNAAAAAQCWSLFRDLLIPSQLRADGSAPREESRTRSLSYSVFNLDALALVCRMARRSGIDLWRYRTPEGVGLLRSIEYLVPYLAEPSKWTKPQIRPLGRDRGYCAGLAGLDTGRREWVELQRGWGVPGNAWGAVLEQLLGMG